MVAVSDAQRDGDLVLPPWLDEQRAGLATLLEREQAPQALLIHGAPGTGRRALAGWFAAQLLGIPGGRFSTMTELVPGAGIEPEFVHPDALLVQPPPEKDSIPVESIRSLIDFLHLKSHQGGARVTIVWPAEAMTRSAANSLLKTLEEPPEGSAIVLVASAAASLPATIVSRCQRVRVGTPPRAAAIAWLQQLQRDVSWDLLLDFAGGAPMRASALHEAGFAARAVSYAEDLQRLRTGRAGPVATAKRWSGAGEQEVLLAWLYREVARELTVALTSEPDNRRLQMAPKHLNIRAGLERLRLVEELYRNRFRSLNPELQFTALLQHWCGASARGE